MHNEEMSAAKNSGVSKKSERALCQKTLDDLKELGLDVGPLFFPQLLKTFERDAVEHLVGLRVAIAGDEPGRLRGEAHALKGASLTIGAQGMADFCQQLEIFGRIEKVGGARETLARLEHEFDRVKNEIELESLTL
jgi:HPt (histidine-containing phosphotransfer) domain-containing protein